MGIVPIPDVPPNATANDAYTLIFSVSTVAEILSSSEPPYASGMPAPRSPISPAFFSGCGHQAFFVLFELGNQRENFFGDEFGMLFGRSGADRR